VSKVGILAAAQLERLGFWDRTREAAMSVRPYQAGDWQEWLRMSLALFPQHSADELAAGMRAHLARPDAEVFLVERDDSSIAGFVEVDERPYADGCDTSPVAYVEAWYVDPDVRRKGYGRALLDAAEDWARARGRTEIASDSQLENLVSHAAHRRAGYEEVDRVVQFRKTLGGRVERI
jgi:aminoglycoside 6'-N-acetyltransferase I